MNTELRPSAMQLFIGVRRLCGGGGYWGACNGFEFAPDIGSDSCGADIALFGGSPPGLGGCGTGLYLVRNAEPLHGPRPPSHRRLAQHEYRVAAVFRCFPSGCSSASSARTWRPPPIPSLQPNAGAGFSRAASNATQGGNPCNLTTCSPTQQVAASRLDPQLFPRSRRLNR